MTRKQAHNSLPTCVVVRLFVIGLAVTLTDGVLATTFEKAISPNYSYTEDVQQTFDGGYVVGATFSSTSYVALVAKLIRAVISSGKSSINSQAAALSFTR